MEHFPSATKTVYPCSVGTRVQTVRAQRAVPFVPLLPKLCSRLRTKCSGRPAQFPTENGPAARTLSPRGTAKPFTTYRRTRETTEQQNQRLEDDVLPERATMWTYPNSIAFKSSPKITGTDNGHKARPVKVLTWAASQSSSAREARRRSAW
jgi:hypothetical protein